MNRLTHSAAEYKARIEVQSCRSRDVSKACRVLRQYLVAHIDVRLVADPHSGQVWGQGGDVRR